MLPETLSHLREHGLVRGDQADRVVIAERCRDELLKKPVADDDQAEIQEKALIVPELRYTLLGEAEDEEVERELDLLVTPLVGGNGLVQKHLENGFVLCAAPVTRKLTHNGEGSITVKRRGRFVTENPDLIERYFWTPAAERLSAAMEAVKNRLELASQRQPLLMARQQPLILKMHERLALELPVKTGDGQ
jgi:hypothetical protein